MRHKSLIFPWLRADIQVSPISLFDQAVCWRRMCVCVHVKTWPCVTTANDHLSIICGGGGAHEPWDFHERRLGTSWTWKRPAEWNVDSSSKKKKKHRYSAKERNLIWICIHPRSEVYWRVFHGIVKSVAGKTQRRNPRERDQNKQKKKNPTPHFLIVSLRDPYTILSRTSPYVWSLSLCLSIRMWLLFSDLYWENSSLPQEDTWLYWAVAVGGLKKKKDRKKTSE